jgi:hypothetical protein
LVGSRLHFTSRLVHQGDNRHPEVVAVNALETTARSTDEGSLGARACYVAALWESDIMGTLETRQIRSEKWG